MLLIYLITIIVVIFGIYCFIRICSGKKTWLKSSLMLIYISIILIFAVTYKWLYDDLPARFNFSKSLSLEKIKQNLDENQKEFQFISSKIEILNLLKTNTKMLHEVSPPFLFGTNRKKIKVDTYRQIIVEQQRRILGESPRNDVGFIITDLKQPNMANPQTHYIYFPIHIPYEDAIDIQIEKYEREKSLLAKEKQKYTNNIPKWDFWDFLYFSSTTITTLGYGDIIPNSKVIRMLTMLETIAGIFFLGVMFTQLGLPQKK